jgi:hypothetical protein
MVYYFTTFDSELAYEVLNIEPNQVYKTDEKGIYYLLKSIIDDPDNFIEYFDKGHSIYLDIDTDLKKITKIAEEHLLDSGFSIPETWSPPKDKPKVEEPEMLTKFYNDSKPIILTKTDPAISKVTENYYEEVKK